VRGLAIFCAAGVAFGLGCALACEAKKSVEQTKSPANQQQRIRREIELNIDVPALIHSC